MVDTKITNLTLKSPPAGTEEIAVNDGGLDKKVLVSDLGSSLTNSNISPTTADVTAAVNTRYFADVSGLTANRNFVLPAGAIGDVIELNIKTGDDTYQLILIGDTGIKINGGTAATAYAGYMAAGDFVKLVADATDNWQIVAEINTSGWLGADAMTYASATTVTISGDVTAKYPVGTKIKLTQTTVKYFYVTAASYSAPNTTLTLTAGTDYTVANAAITLPYYSYANTPQGFPQWFAYTPTFVGFSANPTMVTMFQIVGKQVNLQVTTTAFGTSNATNFTMSAPVTSRNVTNFVAYQPAIAIDNGATIITQWGRASINPNSTTINLYTNPSTGAWTASGNKGANFNLSYGI